MEVIAKKEVAVSITLNEHEVKILMAMVQNPIYENESTTCSEFREKLFTNLKIGLESI